MHDRSQVCICFILSMCSNAETAHFALSCVTRHYQRTATARNTFPVLRHRAASVAARVAPCCLLQNHSDVCEQHMCVCVHVSMLKQTECAAGFASLLFSCRTVRNVVLKVSFSLFI